MTLKNGRDCNKEQQAIILHGTMSSSQPLRSRNFYCGHDKRFASIARGGVVVSGCISPGEQAIARAVREAGLPLIAIIPRGFGPCFKPGGAHFDACAEGKLLMLSPFPRITKTEKLTRERCFGINAVAAVLCGVDPASLRYCGGQPGRSAR